MSNIIDSIQLSGVTYTLSGETNGDVLSGVTLDVTTSNRKLRAYGNKMNGGNTSQSTINFYDGKTIKYTSGNGLYVNFSASTPSITYLNTGSSVIWGFVPTPTPGYEEAFDSLTVNFNSGYTGSTTSYDITVSCSSGGTSSFSDTYTYNVSNNTLTFSSGSHITDVTMDGYTAVFTINSSYSGYKLIYVVNWNGMICGIDTANKDPYSITGVSTSSYDYNGQVIIDDIYTKLGNKQDTLSAGTGISISGNVISATGGGNPTVELTQAEYDTLVTAGTVSADTYYIITDAYSPDISAITSAVTSGSTDSEIPTAKAVYTAIPIVTNTITSGSTEAITSGAVYDAIGDIETLLSQI